MIHTKQSELANTTVLIKKEASQLGGQEIRVEDWWDRVGGGSWMDATGNPACLGYAARTGFSKEPIPLNNDVIYGKIDGLGYLVHISELES